MEPSTVQVILNYLPFIQTEQKNGHIEMKEDSQEVWRLVMTIQSTSVLVLTMVMIYTL